MIDLDLNKVFNRIEEAVVVIDIKGVILRLNKSAEQLNCFPGIRLHQGARLFDKLDVKWQIVANQFIKNLTTFQSPASFDAVGSDPDGKKVYCEIKCTPITDDTKQVSEIIVIARDVTLQKIFENKITSIANELRGLIEHANAIIIGIDCRGYVTEWNEMCSLVTGYLKNESLTCPLTDILLEEESSLSFSLTIKEVLKGKRISNFELTIKAKNQKKLIFLINATPRKNAEGHVIGILLVGQDITELSRYRNSLEQIVDERTDALQSALKKEKALVAMKNRFVAIASHEFKSPLSSIHFTVESIKTNMGNVSQSEMMTRMNSIQSNIRHMSVLLEDVLTIGKSNAEVMKPNLSALDLKSFLVAIIKDVQNNTKNSHQVIMDFQEAALSIESDEKLLRNIFINLLNNAIKFSPCKREVFLSVNVKSTVAEITIRDNGIGIGEKDLEVVFEPFNRGSNVGQIAGTGLGLSIVKKAVDTLGGKLFVQSKINEGTVFTVELNLTI